MTSAERQKRRDRRVLVCLLPGLGDALCASPLMRSLYEDGAYIDVLTMLGAVSVYARALDFVSNVHQLPLLSEPVRSLPGLLRLRKANYDEVYVPFPATRWQYSLVARLIAKRTLVMHDYSGLSRVVSRAGAIRLVPLRGGHRAIENLRLSPNAVTTAPPLYEVPQEWRRGVLRDLVGVHFGTMVYKKNEARRWPLQKFVEVVRNQLEKRRRVRLFVGPSERSDALAFSEFHNNAAFEVVDEPLEKAAQLVSECSVFVANDAGFAHLAAALGVQAITLFGMTDPTRAQPVGRTIALRPSACPPCHDEGLAVFGCSRNLAYRCMVDDFPVSHVELAIEQALSQGLSSFVPQSYSNFQLYGRLQLVENDEKHN